MQRALIAHKAFLETRYFTAFDGLRAVAIAGVIWHHCLPGPQPGWLGRAHVGVPLFFALSGFLITTLLLAEQRTTGTIALVPFWIRRSLRIFPLYYAVLASFALVLAFYPPTLGTRHFFEHLLFHASYTSNWFIDYAVPHPVWFAFGWSLATEEQFYVWWPPLLRRLLRSGTAAVAMTLLGMICLDQLLEHRAFAAWLDPSGTTERVLASFAPALALGSLAAVLLADRRTFRWVWALLGRRESAAACVCALAGLLWRPTGPFLLFELLLASLVVACSLTASPVTRVLGSRPFAQVGRVSYGMYLFHVPVIGSWRRALPWLVEHPGMLFPAALLTSFGAATLSYRHIEAPLLAHKERFRPRGQQPVVTSRAPTQPAASLET